MRTSLLLFLLFLACHAGFAQAPVSKGKDSLNLNKTDDQGRRTGYWKVTGAIANRGEYAPNALVEEGTYDSGMKVGIWKLYFPNGVLHNRLTYVENRPNGYAIMYHENGKIYEEGLWKYNRWVGNYKLYYDNGNVQHEFNFNANGKREGKQVYWNEDGVKIIEGNWAEGHEDGVLKEWYDDGQPKADKFFDGGNLNVEKTKLYTPKTALPEKKPEVVVDPKLDTKVKASEQDLGGNKAQPVSGNATAINGQATIYNKNRQVSKTGNFVNGKMVSGKIYIYNDNGILTRIAVYENGMYKGDAPVEE